MDTRAKELIRQGDQLFSTRAPLLSLWQEIADNFYPQRADFTLMRNIGQDFGGNLTTSYPILAHRELSGMISSLLRPASEDWFHLTIAREDKLTNSGRSWLEWASSVMRRAMYDQTAQFIRATKESDHDFTAFGQAVISTRLNRNRNGLIYKNFHLRDVVWCEGDDGIVDTVHRKWKPTARDLIRLFGTKQGQYGKMGVHAKVIEAAEKDPYCKINCRHVIIPSDYYDTGSAPDPRGKWRTPFVSVYVDLDNEHILEEVGLNYMEYTVPRWQTVSGSQYAYSPCTVAALPDARLIQAMTLVLLEAGEKATNPPIIATADVVRSDINIMAGGVTWVDRDYDERIGEAMRPMLQDTSGIPLGMELRADIKAQISEAFYLNKISLPPMGKDMTAFEVSQRIQEYIRNALPLFEPMENDYNGSVCDNTFQVLMDGGAFGAALDMPQELRGQDVRFKFESPLHEAADKQKGQRFLETKAMLAEAIAMDNGVGAMLDVKAAIRDVLEGIGTPAKWMLSEGDMAAKEAALQEQAETMQMLQMMQAGGEVAATAGKASRDLAEAGVL